MKRRSEVQRRLMRRRAVLENRKRRPGRVPSDMASVRMTVRRSPSGSGAAEALILTAMAAGLAGKRGVQ